MREFVNYRVGVEVLENPVVLLQARTSSKRLPAKVLLPIGPYPIFQLAYLRLSNKGMPVILCTSSDPSDDLLCYHANHSGTMLFRGSLSDVLGRFAECARSYDGRKIIVRATSDNVFPDGNFVNVLVEYYKKKRLKYLCANGKESNLPDGVKVEIFRNEDLQEAANFATTEYEREHVTPYIIRKHSETFFKMSNNTIWGKLRATIDTLDDYQVVAKIFTGIDDPVSIGYEELCKRLELFNE